MAIGTRIKEARCAAKMTQKELAAKVGVKQATISELETGRSSGTTLIASFAFALKVSALWLETGKGSRSTTIKEEINLENNPDYPAIRRVNLRLSAGITGFTLDYEDGEHDMIVFKRRWYDAHGFNPDKLIAIRVQGQSMEYGLYQGDTVVVNTGDNEPHDGDVFAINYEGEAVIKRLIRDRGEWWLSSDNADQMRYPRKVCSGASCIIIGKIVHKQSERI